MIITDPVCNYHNVGPGISFLHPQNLSTFEDCKICLLWYGNFKLMRDAEIQHIIDTGKFIYIDQSAEIAEIDILDILDRFDDLSSVYYYFSSFHPSAKSKISALKERGLNVVCRQFFIDESDRYVPVFSGASYERKKFLLYTGKTKVERTLLVSLLSYEGLLPYGYVSYFGNDCVEDLYGFRSWKREDVLNLNLTSEQKDKVTKGIKSLPNCLLLDEPTFGYRLAHTKEYNGDLYRVIDFAIVAETYCFHDVFFPTEKVVKCIQNNVKFIVMSNQHYLKRLKAYYLETKGQDISDLTDWCDTYYDDELDPIKRIEMIVDIVKENIK